MMTTTTSPSTNGRGLDVADRAAIGEVVRTLPTFTPVQHQQAATQVSHGPPSRAAHIYSPPEVRKLLEKLIIGELIPPVLSESREIVVACTALVVRRDTTRLPLLGEPAPVRTHSACVQLSLEDCEKRFPNERWEPTSSFTDCVGRALGPWHEHAEPLYAINAHVKPTLWQRVKRVMHSGMMHFTHYVPCCGTDQTEYWLDRDIQRSVDRELVRRRVGDGLRDCVDEAMLQTARLDGYTMTTPARLRLLVEETEDTCVDSFDDSQEKVAKIVPRFVASMTLAIRSKLGRMEATDANLLLVQRKYLEICRHKHVRDVDRVSHQQRVLNNVFANDLFERSATVRRRVPRWVRWLEPDQAKPAGPSVVA